MLSFLYDLFDAYELLKAICVALLIVLMVRAWAYSIKDRAEREDAQREIEEGEKDTKRLEQIIPVSSSIYDENDCSICKKPIWTRECIEIEKGCTVELKCSHRFHWKCLHSRSSSPSETPPSSPPSEPESSYVMVDNVPRCPECHFQPTVIEAKPLHKWQTVRFWVLIIDEALDQLATMSNRYGVSWANVRHRARKMSGITLAQLAKGEEQTYGKEIMDAEEDLDGPGKFPFFAALKDGNAIRFHDSIDNVFHRSAGKWLTYQSDRGGERMVFKYSWGLPPFSSCHNCDKALNSSPGGEERETEASVLARTTECDHLLAKKKYWCSAECLRSHEEETKSLLNKWERFRMTKSLS